MLFVSNLIYIVLMFNYTNLNLFILDIFFKFVTSFIISLRLIIKKIMSRFFSLYFRIFRSFYVFCA